MSVNTRVVAATPEEVWDVLADGWLYPVWVVGASRMREVEDAWPAVGAKLHHSVGVWPLLIDDYTEVLESLPGESLTLRARGWPVGEAQVHLQLTPQGTTQDTPQGTETEIRIEEKAVSGPGALVPPPLEGLTLRWRNTETLRRLAFLAERRR